jgi:hypothetical protein
MKKYRIRSELFIDMDAENTAECGKLLAKLRQLVYDAVQDDDSVTTIMLSLGEIGEVVEFDPDSN